MWQDGRMKIALVHDYLSQHGGAEEVLIALHRLYPAAPIFVLFAEKKKFPELASADIRESFLARMPFIQKHYQWYLPLMPLATEHHDLSEFDVIISSTSAFAKGIITHAGAMHMCYCHTPTRYLWSDTHSYVEELPRSRLIKWAVPPILSLLRVWDRIAASRVEIFIANSVTVQKRIKKYYGRESIIVYPGIDTERFTRSTHPPADYFLAGGRLVAYKKFDWIVEACTRLQVPLKIFGEGPVRAELQKIAGPTVEFLGRVTPEQQATLYARCRAFIQPQVEDFGMTAVEAMACGRPVIALPRGGSTETVINGVTGLFMRYDGWEGVLDALLRFDSTLFDPKIISAHAQQFSRQNFDTRINAVVARAGEATHPTS